MEDVVVVDAKLGGEEEDLKRNAEEERERTEGPIVVVNPSAFVISAEADVPMLVATACWPKEVKAEVDNGVEETRITGTGRIFLAEALLPLVL